MSDVTDAVDRAVAAFSALRSLGRDRARLLTTLAAGLEAERDQLVRTAHAETALAPELLDAEVTRTAEQLRLFAHVLVEGSYLGATVDSAPAGMPGGTGVRRWLVPVGPVAVFGASNFPFAYGVAGGDTASALAAGCPVVVKEHPSHVRTCALVLQTLRAAAVEAGCDADVITMVSGFEAGAALVQEPRIRAVGFTGSLRGGRALFDLCTARPAPIPFYGELGSVNAAVVTSGAAAARPDEVAAALATSILTRGGQVCTKAGLIFVPHDGDRLVTELAERVRAAEHPVLLNDAIWADYLEGVATRMALRDVRQLVREQARVTGGAEGPSGGRSPVVPTLLTTDAGSLADPANRILLEECFGPISVVVRYRDGDDLRRALTCLPSALVAALHAEPAEETGELVDLLSQVAGRVVWNDATTGLRVGWATHHGGGYPASTAEGTTSVGVHAIERWLRPVAFQGVPLGLLPRELCDGDGPDAPPVRRDGVLRTWGGEQSRSSGRVERR